MGESGLVDQNTKNTN